MKRDDKVLVTDLQCSTEQSDGIWDEGPAEALLLTSRVKMLMIVCFLVAANSRSKV